MTDSDNVELKKRSRRRLVGAAALALFAAVVLPMVMDQEPAAPAQDIQITIPDRDANAVLARPIAGQDQASEAQVAPAPEEQAPTAAGAEPPARTGAPDAGGDVQTDAGTRSPPSDQKTAGAVAADPAGKAPSKAGEAERAKAILEGRQAAAASTREGFVVQIGAFAEAGKAGTIAAELKKRGLQAYTEQAGAMTRVRIGPFPSRDEAEAAAQRVRAGGFNGSVMSR